MTRQPDPRNDQPQVNEGEGSKTADREYRQNVEKFLQHENPDELGRQAKEEIERNPGPYREAEKVGKSHVAEEDPELKK